MKYIQLEIKDIVYTVDYDKVMADDNVPAEHKEKIRHQVEDLGKRYLIIIDEREMN